MMSVPSLSSVELLRLCTVLQDCADQLAVQGHIMPDATGRPEADMVVSSDIGEVPRQQKGTEQNLKAARQSQLEAGGILDATRQLHKAQKDLSRTRHNPLSPDNLAKVQRDRTFVAQVISDLLAELQESGSFRSLLLAVEQEKKRKAHLLDIIIREEEGRRRTKALQRQVLDINKEKTLDLQRRDETRADLKDLLQEMKAKTGLEKKYAKSSAELLTYQGQKLNTLTEKKLGEEIQILSEQMEEEKRVNLEMEMFLKAHHTRLGEKLEVWMERYERDMENKQQELTSLKSNKINNLSQLQELARKYRASEEVVKDDRVEKENLRKQREREQLERNAATKVQAWWRGTLVRRGLGHYKKGKKTKEGKKGKGKGKKKK